MSDEEKGLRELAERVRFELDCVNYPAREWVRPRTHLGLPVHDAVIVGGGQNGLGVAFRLMRERVTNIRVLDRSAAGQAGPWISFARMHTLRTPKTVSGPELGLASLSVRAWYEARFGPAAWTGLGKIGRRHWNDYLVWLQATAGIDVTHEAEVVDIEPLDPDLFAVHTAIAGRTEPILARHVVLATGIEGSGRWLVPQIIEQNLPRERYAHTSQAIDFAALAGKRIAVIGASASAFDNAGTALEQGAASVELFCRRGRLPRVNPNRWIEFAGFMRHFADLDDGRKWQFMKTYFDMNQPPPQDTFDRCARFARFDLRLASPIEAATFEDGEIRLTTRGHTRSFDFLIAGTGFAIDLAARPELARFADRIARWSDRYHPPAGQEHPLMGGYPYLGGSFEYQEKVPGTAPFLGRLYNHTYGAMMSLGGAAGVSQLKFSTERIVFGITRRLFIDDADASLASLKAHDVSELDTAVFDAMHRQAASDAA